MSALTVLLLTACSNNGLNARSPSSATLSNFYVSMAPSNTELLYAIDAQDNLAGVCTQCDYPLAAKKLPKVGNFIMPDLEKLAQVRPKSVFLVNGQEQMGVMIGKQKAFVTRVEILRN